MECERCREEIARLLAADWDAPEAPRALPPDAAEHARDCPRCGALAEAAQELISGTQAKLSAPEGLAERVSDTILQRQESENRGLTLFRRSAATLNRWVLQAAAAVLLVVASALVTTWVITSGKSEKPQTVTVRLELRAPRAEEVAVVGDWNGWDPGTHPMTDADGDGIWQIEIEVESDREYQYQFLINGERWIPDPQAPMRVKDGFGGENSVLNI